MQSHVRDSCLYTEVPCEERLCEKMVARKDAAHSVHGALKELNDSSKVSRFSLHHCALSNRDVRVRQNATAAVRKLPT